MIEAWFDGACEPRNPGGHGAFGAFILKDEKEILLQESRYLGFGPGMSNNVAEYSGFICIMEYLMENNCQHETVLIRGDSNLVVQQVAGRWKIKQGIYVPYAIKARSLYLRFPGHIAVKWIPREQNDKCDRLSKNALKKQGVVFQIQKED